MGEEEKEKKPAAEEAKKPEEKKEEKAAQDEKQGDEAAKEAKESPPTEVVLRVFMHCEGCARKVRRSLKGLDGVEDVITDCKSSKVVVKGEKAAVDPLKVLDRVERKSHRQVELISPIPKPPPKEEEEEKKQEPNKVIVVVLKVHMHCQACAQEIKKRIQRMKGVESAEPDLKNSQVAVKGVFEPSKLVEYVYKQTGKHTVIVKQEPEKKEDADEKPKEEVAAPKVEEGGDGGGEKKGGKEEVNKEEEGKAVREESKVVELKKNELYYYPPRYDMELDAYPPQIFSDDNPNACSLM